MKKKTMTCRLKIFGIELTKDYSAILRLLFLAMILSGRRILNIRRDLTAEMLTPGGITKPARADITMTKSRIFHGSLM